MKQAYTGRLLQRQSPIPWSGNAHRGAFAFVSEESADSPEEKKKRDQPKKGKDAAGKNTTLKCFFCEKPGHRQRDCRTLAKLKAQHFGDEVTLAYETFSADSDLADDDDCRQWVLSATESASPTAYFYVDSGATSNMCNNRELFKDFQHHRREYVTAAGGQQLESLGRGRVQLSFNSKDKDPVTLTNVMLVPRLKKNLVSVPKMVRYGNVGIFKGEHMRFETDEGETILTGTLHRSGLYLVDDMHTERTSPSEEVAMSVFEEDPPNMAAAAAPGKGAALPTASLGTSGAAADDDSDESKLPAAAVSSTTDLVCSNEDLDVPSVVATRELYAQQRMVRLHRQLGHVHGNALRFLQKNELLDGIGKERLGDLPPCAACAGGKMQRASLKRTSARAIRVLQMIHGDLIVVNVATVDGERYLLLLVDDCSAYAFGFLLKSKADTFAAFRDWHAQVTVELGVNIACFQADQGGEFRSQAFADFCRQQGIRQQFAATATPEQNGLVERRGRFVFETTRTILLDSALPHAFWGFAALHAVHITNLMVNKRTGMTAYETFKQRKPTISTLMPFGCTAWVRVLDKNRKKLDAKATRMPHLGYADSIKGWRFWDTEQQRLVETPHATFHPEEMFMDAGYPALISPSTAIETAPAPVAASAGPAIETAPAPVAAPAGPATGAAPATGTAPTPELQGRAESISAAPAPAATPIVAPIVDTRELTFSPVVTFDSPPFEGPLNGHRSASAASAPAPAPASAPAASAPAPAPAPAPTAAAAAHAPLTTSASSPAPHLTEGGQTACGPQIEGGRTQQSLPMGGMSESAHYHGGFDAASGEPSTVQAGAAAADAPPARRSSRETRGTRTKTHPCGGPLGSDSEWACMMAEMNHNLTLARDVFTPRSYHEAVNCDDADGWIAAIDEEMDAHATNGTWKLVKLPKGRRAIGSKWVFKVKIARDGTTERLKARLVARGFEQRKGLDFTETFAPVSRMESNRLLFAVAAARGLKLRQFDIRTAYLNGVIRKVKVYMKQPPGRDDGSGRVCLLIKALYGLKQAGREWEHMLRKVLRSIGLRRCHADLCVYYMVRDTKFLIMTVSVDDLAVAHDCDELCDYVITSLREHFVLTDLGELDWILGMGVTRDDATGSITIDQATYCNAVLARFQMSDVRPVATPAEPIAKDMDSPPFDDITLYRSMLGALMYLSTSTRPDISFAVARAGRHSAAPTKAHFLQLKRIMRYLAGTRTLGITFHRDPNNEVKLVGYCDADWANCSASRKSVTGNLLQVAGGPVIWTSKLQPIVALSSTEAELISLTMGTQSALWCRGWLEETGNAQTSATVMYEDNQSTISLSAHPRSYGRTKHIAARWFFCREASERGDIEVVYLPTSEMLADMLTKPVPAAVLMRLRDKAMGNV